MDFMLQILNTIVTVITSKIYDMVTGSAKAAKIDEIEQEVIKRLKDDNPINQQTIQLVTEEINLLLAKDSNFIISNGLLEIKRFTEKTSLSEKRGDDTGYELQVMLSAFQEAVIIRRKEIEAHLNSEKGALVEQEQALEKDTKKPQVEWVEVGQQKVGSDLPVEIQNWKANVRRRRDRGDFTDE